MEMVKPHTGSYDSALRWLIPPKRLQKTGTTPKHLKNRHPNRVVSEKRELLSKVCVNSLIVTGAFDEIILHKVCMKCNFYS